MSIENIEALMSDKMNEWYKDNGISLYDHVLMRIGQRYIKDVSVEDYRELVETTFHRFEDDEDFPENNMDISYMVSLLEKEDE